MKITVESTSQVTMLEVGGVPLIPGRIWEGTTEDGIPIQVVITRVAVHKDQDMSQFLQELADVSPREPSYRAFEQTLKVGEHDGRS